MPRSGERQRGAKPCCGHVGLRQAQANAVGPAIESCCRIYNYTVDPGAGSHTITAISDSPGWRAALLGTVAAGTLLLSTPRAAKANCVGPAPTLTCTGTISGTAGPGVVNGGIKVPAGYSTLNVNNITANITPNTGVDGIYFHRVGAGNNIVIDSDTTPKAIVVNGASADGIDAQSAAAITIDHVGDIDASVGRDAIFAQVLSGGTALSITTAGELIGASTGIEARNSGTGALSVVVNGDVAGGTSVGIYARNVTTATGDLSITTDTGTSVTGGQAGILARNFGSHALKIVTNGDVVGTNTIGIFARNGTIVTPAGTYLSVTTGPGTVSGRVYGIQALNYGSGALTITTTGDVTGAASNSDSVGIIALNGYGVIIPAAILR